MIICKDFTCPTPLHHSHQQSYDQWKLSAARKNVKQYVCHPTSLLQTICFLKVKSALPQQIFFYFTGRYPAADDHIIHGVHGIKNLMGKLFEE